jgi:hypothetical protein
MRRPHWRNVTWKLLPTGLATGLRTHTLPARQLHLKLLLGAWLSPAVSKCAIVRVMFDAPDHGISSPQRGSQRTMRAIRRGWPAAVAALALAGCGSSTPVGGSSKEFTPSLRDNTPTTTSSLHDYLVGTHVGSGDNFGNNMSHNVENKVYSWLSDNLTRKGYSPSPLAVSSGNAEGVEQGWALHVSATYGARHYTLPQRQVLAGLPSSLMAPAM